MLVSSAVTIINESVIFFPGWKIRAEDFTTRHEGCICLHIEGTSWETNRPEAMAGYPTVNHPRVTVLLQVGNIADDLELHRAVLGKLIDFMVHEAREAYRIKPTGWAPFHPHKIDGMNRWGEVDKDLTYGFNAMNYSES